MPRTVTLYEAALANTCCPVEASMWTLVPKEHRLGEVPAGHDFVMPDELDVSSSMFGKFFVLAGTSTTCKLHFTPTGDPLVIAPDGTSYKLERA